MKRDVGDVFESATPEIKLMLTQHNNIFLKHSLSRVCLNIYIYIYIYVCVCVCVWDEFCVCVLYPLTHPLFFLFYMQSTANLLRTCAISMPLCPRCARGWNRTSACYNLQANQQAAGEFLRREYDIENNVRECGVSILISFIFFFQEIQRLCGCCVKLYLAH